MDVSGHGSFLQRLQQVERLEAGIGPMGRDVARETDEGLLPVAVRTAAPSEELSKTREQGNDDLAKAIHASLGVYNLVVPVQRGSIEKLTDVALTPMHIYRGPVPWIQRPMPRMGTGIIDPATLRDITYMQRVKASLKAPKLPPGIDTKESLEAYCDGLAKEVEEAATTNLMGLTFEEQNILQLRLIAAHDLLTINTCDSLILYTEEERNEMMEKVRTSECALRSLNAINRCRPDDRAPHLLTSTPADGWFYVTSDELFSAVIDVSEKKRHRVRDNIPRTHDGQLTLGRLGPDAVLAEVQKLLNCHVDVLFPRVPDPENLKRRAVPNRCIGIGLLPIVMAFMDLRFLTLNPLRTVCPYVLNVARTQLWSRGAASLYYDVQIRQLEHNIDWAIQLDHLNDSNVSLASRLYTWSHHQFTSTAILKLRAGIHFMETFVREKHGQQTLDELMASANAYANAKAQVPPGDTMQGRFERDMTLLATEGTAPAADTGAPKTHKRSPSRTDHDSVSSERSAKKPRHADAPSVEDMPRVAPSPSPSPSRVHAPPQATTFMWM